jgi:hypothetical protein
MTGLSVRVSTAVLELLSGEDQALLVGRSLDLRLDDWNPRVMVLPVNVFTKLCIASGTNPRAKRKCRW